MAKVEWMICEGAGKCGKDCITEHRRRHLKNGSCGVSCCGYRCIPYTEPVTGLDVEPYHLNPKTVEEEK